MAILTGDNSGNILRGGNGDDRISGLGGADILSGGRGNDIILGGSGDDLILDLFGEDQIDGGSGLDAIQVDLSESSGSVSFCLIHGLYIWSGGGGPISNVEIGRIIGGAFSDGLFGGSGDDYFEGRGGDDRLVGLAGDDEIRGGDGDDRIFGNSGNDILSGDKGRDKLTGQFGADVFIHRNGDGRDVFTDFNVLEDIVDLAGHGFKRFADVSASLSDTGLGALLDLGDGDSIRFDGVAVAAFGAEDFRL